MERYGVGFLIHVDGEAVQFFSPLPAGERGERHRGVEDAVDAAICLVSPGHVASNPRLVKEADALCAAGFHVLAHHRAAD